MEELEFFFERKSITTALNKRVDGKDNLMIVTFDSKGAYVEIGDDSFKVKSHQW